jgi:hypothetical protein
MALVPPWSLNTGHDHRIFTQDDREWLDLAWQRAGGRLERVDTDPPPGMRPPPVDTSWITMETVGGGGGWIVLVAVGLIFAMVAGLIGVSLL